MNATIYLLQVSACTAIFYLFYIAVLQKLTFFTINRWYLLVSLMLSFAIPGITIPDHKIPVEPVLSQDFFDDNTPLQLKITSNTEKQSSKYELRNVDWRSILMLFYSITAAILAINFVTSIILLVNRLKASKAEKIGDIKLIRGDLNFKNGSFLNYIFINDNGLNSIEAEQIILHEMEHARRHHSIDKVFSRCVQIILWFNPIIYLYSKSIEENHEYEVDKCVVQNSDKLVYVELIFKLSTNSNGIYFNHFSKFPLRRRIQMLSIAPSASLKKFIYVLIIPVIVISCIAFANRKKGVENTVKRSLSLRENNRYRSENPVNKGSGAGNWKKTGIVKNSNTVMDTQDILSSVPKENKVLNPAKSTSSGYPSDQTSIEEAVKLFYGTTDPVAIKIVFRYFMNDNTEKAHWFGRFLATIGEGPITSERAKFEAYTDKISDKFDLANIYRAISWQIIQKNGDINYAAYLSKQALNILDEQRKSPSGSLLQLSQAIREKVLEDCYAYNSYGYSVALFNQGKYEEALPHTKYTIDYNKASNTGMNARYVQILDSAGKTFEAKKFAEEFIASGRGSERIVEQLRSLNEKLGR